MSIAAADMTACRHTLALSANGQGLLPGQDQGRGGQEKNPIYPHQDGRLGTMNTLLVSLHLLVGLPFNFILFFCIVLFLYVSVCMSYTRPDQWPTHLMCHLIQPTPVPASHCTLLLNLSRLTALWVLNLVQKHTHTHTYIHRVTASNIHLYP